MTAPGFDMETGWARLFALLDAGWPGELTPDAADAYRTLLEGVSPDVIVDALRQLLHAGHKFRPTAAEILGRAQHDPSRPTFDEAYALIFGAGGALNARRQPGRYPDAAAVGRADDDAVWGRLADMHPLVGEFVRRQGLDRLRQMPVDDPDEGMWRRKELRDAWELHVDAFDGREVAAIASGTGREGMRQLDPLAGLPGELAASARRELTQGAARS
jgi:hypothetical protein